MLPTRRLLSASSLLSALFGSLGVFSTIYSYEKPSLVPYALILLGSAFVLAYISNR
jgi:hypothetical protein